ncbi:MAG: phosphotransferase [Defluviitaleaceae bacterium]|nr:phosphotransferase [Defluviitaleaceae bacterium]
MTPITKGWSKDKKFKVTRDGKDFLLRISSADRYEHRKLLFGLMQQVAELGVPICDAVKFSHDKDGVHMLQRWIDGEDLEDVLPTLSETEQYALGVKTGEYLQKMHTIPAPETRKDWEAQFNAKIDWILAQYGDCGLRFDGDELVMAYIEENRGLLKNRPQCFQHGDYHIGNMMMENGELVIIDFDRYSFGDPWQEFNRTVWSAKASPHFATGQLREYFEGEPPMDFFRLLALYICGNALAAIPWAIPFGQADVDVMINQSQDVLAWYNNMKNPVPTWYLREFCV